MDLPIPAELAYDDAPPLTDEDLERWESSVLALADDAHMDVDAAALQLLEAMDRPALLVVGGAISDEAVADAGGQLLADVPQTEAKRPWSIEDDDAAEWAMRKVAAIDQDLAELRERAAGWAERIQRWFSEASRPLQARRLLLTYKLEQYGKRERETSGRKTVKLPSGKVGTRSAQAAAKVAVEPLVIAWAKEHLEGDELAAVVKVVESVRVSDLRNHVTVGRVLVQTEWLATLACEHTVEGVWLPDGTGSVEPEVAEILACDTCGEGAAVAHVETRQRWRDAVLDADGKEVPGCVVEPEHVTATVTPA